jgi:hypothetical protein
MRDMKTPTLIAFMMLCSLAILHAGEKPAPAQNAPAAEASSTPSTIAAGESNERVSLPLDYATRMRRVGDVLYNENSGVTTIFANELAASTAGFSQEGYPNGSMILMEFAQPQRDGEGELLRDARGVPIKGPIESIAVMRRGVGFGAPYGAERAGDWEFASYRADGSTLIAPDNAAHCASCHRKAGADRDFVYRKRSWNTER